MVGCHLAIYRRRRWQGLGPLDPSGSSVPWHALAPLAACCTSSYFQHIFRSNTSKIESDIDIRATLDFLVYKGGLIYIINIEDLA